MFGEFKQQTRSLRRNVDGATGCPTCYFSGRVIVELKDGRTLRYHERSNRGAGDRQLSHEEICAKFRDNVSDHLNSSRAQALMNAVIRLEGLSGRTFGDALRAA